MAQVPMTSKPTLQNAAMNYVLKLRDRKGWWAYVPGVVSHIDLIRGIANEYVRAVQEWEDGQFPQTSVFISENSGLIDLRTKLLDGRYSPRRTTAMLVGPVSQVASKAYNALYKVRALRRRGDLGTAARIVSATGQSLAGDFSAPLSLFLRECGDLVYREEQFQAALCLPMANIVCDILVAGLHLHSNDGETVKLKGGMRKRLPTFP